MAKRTPPAAPPAAPEQRATVTYLAPRRWLKLVKAAPEPDTVALLKALLQQAEAGELSGVVVVSLNSPSNPDGNKYDYSLGGIAFDNPTLALGALELCGGLLREFALKDAGLD